MDLLRENLPTKFDQHTGHHYVQRTIVAKLVLVLAEADENHAAEYFRIPEQKYLPYKNSRFCHPRNLLVDFDHLAWRILLFDPSMPESLRGFNPPNLAGVDAALERLLFGVSWIRRLVAFWFDRGQKRNTYFSEVLRMLSFIENILELKAGHMAVMQADEDDEVRVARSNAGTIVVKDKAPRPEVSAKWCQWTMNRLHFASKKWLLQEQRRDEARDTHRLGTYPIKQQYIPLGGSKIIEQWQIALDSFIVKLINNDDEHSERVKVITAQNSTFSEVFPRSITTEEYWKFIKVKQELSTNHHKLHPYLEERRRDLVHLAGWATKLKKGTRNWLEPSGHALFFVRDVSLAYNTLSLRNVLQEAGDEFDAQQL